MEEKRGPGRPRKPERRRKGKVGGQKQKLYVHESDRDPKFTYRWINDQKSRVHDLTVNDDWDIVDRTEGSARTEIVGTGANGEPITGYLVRKPKEFYEADKAEKAAEIDKKVEALRNATVESGYGEVRIESK